MGKQKTSQSTSYSGSSNPAFLPAANAAIGSVQSVYNQNQPNLQATTDLQRQQVVDPLLGQFRNTAGPANQASGYYSDVLGGKYMNGNPYLGAVTSQLNRNINDQVSSNFEGAGRYGSDAYAGTLARETGAADANLAYNDYNDRLAQMQQAAQGASGQNLGTEQALASAVGQNAALPYVGTQALSGSLGQLMNGGTSNSTTWGPNPIFGAIGAGLGAAGQAASGGFFGRLSDRRAKTKIELLYRDPDGLGWYNFAYKTDPNTILRGVMADEVKELRPQAYVENYRGSGYAGVNYARLAA